MSTQDSKPSTLLFEECFAAADDRFLEEWCRFNRPEFLAGFLKRWLADPRPWARQQFIRYLQLDLNLPGHEIVVKRLSKHLFDAGDYELLAHLMVAFDRFVRRSRVTRHNWNTQTREVVREQLLFAKPNKTIQNEIGRTTQWGIGKFKRTVPLPDRLNKQGNRLFSHRTRNHLRRRVWRYFRWLSYRDSEAYLSAMTTAIIHYQDTDFAVGENILDNWSLMHVCYFHSDILRFNAAHTNLKSDSSLAELSAAPYRRELWQQPNAVVHLTRIISTARSSLARIWAIEILEIDHREATQKIDVHWLLQLMSHADPRVQQFSSGVFRLHQGIANLPITTWLELLNQCDAALLPTICDAMKTHVSAARLGTQQLIQLTSARPVPVAEFGLTLLKIRHTQQPLTDRELTSLCNAQCEAIADQIAHFALSALNIDHYQAERVIDFFDSLLSAMRSASMDWLEQPDSRGYKDPVLWARLIETPFDDIRLRVVECLHRRTRLPGAEADTLAPVWCSVILGVHRGGRTKLKAITQIQTAILQHPARSSELLPVLAVAARSLRAPEQRGALAAIASIVKHNAELQPEIQRLLPELQWI